MASLVIQSLTLKTCDALNSKLQNRLLFGVYLVYWHIIIIIYFNVHSGKSSHLKCTRNTKLGIRTKKSKPSYYSLLAIGINLMLGLQAD